MSICVYIYMGTVVSPPCYFEGRHHDHRHHHIVIMIIVSQLQHRHHDHRGHHIVIMISTSMAFGFGSIHWWNHWF